MSLLKKIYFDRKNQQGFPYDLSFFNQMIDMDTPITILIGENGCGKTTLLSLIQSNLGLFCIGQPLKPMMTVPSKFSFHLKKPQGFYFSAEDFTTYIYELEKEKAYAKKAIKEVDETYKNKSDYAKMMAKGPYHKTLFDINQLHDRDLLNASHGESYLSFFKSRLRPNQLILLDEPETPLSFQNQLALLYLLQEGIKDGCQFIIATHSPLMMAYPKAKILEIDDQGVHQISYDNIEQVNMLKDFLNHPNRYFNQLFKT